jgi:gliding motility-associated-like protein
VIIFGSHLSISQTLLKSFDFSAGLDQWQTTEVSSINYWCVEENVYSIEGYSLQICSNGAPGYYGANGYSPIVYFNLNAENYSNMTLEFDWKCNGETGLDFGTVYFSVSSVNGNTPVWNELTTNLQRGDNAVYSILIKLPLITNNQNNLKIGFSFKSDSNFNFQPGFVVDNIKLKGYQCAFNYPSPPAQQSPFRSCYDDSEDAYLMVETLPGLNYRWYRNEINSFFHTGGSLITHRLSDQNFIVTSVNGDGCESRPPHTIVYLDVLPNPTIELVSLTGTNVGYDGQIEIHADGGAPPYEILWQSEYNDSLAYNTLNVNSLSAGTYSVVVTDQNQCDSVRYFTVEEGSSVIVPSAFSPNGDGLNDFWELEGIAQLEDYELSVFTLNNRIVHFQSGKDTNGFYSPWDGRSMHTGQPVADGDYVFVLTSEQKKRKYRGLVSIKTK